MDAHGGWVISSADMVRFADAVDGRSGLPALLTPATLRLATTPDPKVRDIARGLGVIVTNAGWYHSGETMTPAMGAAGPQITIQSHPTCC